MDGQPAQHRPQPLHRDFIRFRKKRSRESHPMAEGAGRNSYERNQIEEAINHLLLQLLKEGDHAESSKILQIPIQRNLETPEMTMTTDNPKMSEEVEEAAEEAEMETV